MFVCFALGDFQSKGEVDYFEAYIKVGHVRTAGTDSFPCVVNWNKLWKLIMQLVKSKNCPALCLDSSRLILVVSVRPQGARGRGTVSFHYKYMSASKCGGPEAGEGWPRHCWVAGSGLQDFSGR